MAGGLILAGQHPHVSDPVVVEVRDAEGRPRSSLGEHPGDERYISPDGYRSSPIFSALAMQLPWGDLVIHNLNNRYEIKAFAQDGSLARIVRRDHVARPPTREERLNHLWVEEYEPPGQERPGSLWTVFDPEGRVLARTRCQSHFT